jgi:hypothetical protein
MVHSKKFTSEQRVIPTGKTVKINNIITETLQWEIRGPAM